ncbi:MAG TPA: carboxypeptidase regulatory-like domain-containing protein [Pyrinomonadaceae bacterium]|nr:carboxypeptidase regulatory-like domain-containing protein [Pyrinomonadaceae bacterium]
MRRKYFFYTFLVAAMLLVTNSAASAQTGQLFGEVVMKQADGTGVPVAGAQIDVYRVDLTGKYNTKTDKSGKFVFAGLPYTGTYIITASAPNADPDMVADVKAGREVSYKLVLSPGGGRRLTEAEAKSVLKAGAAQAAGESAEDRKKREELEAKNKEIMASNEKNSKINETIGRTFKAGNEALQAKRHDDAITQYNDGLAVDSEQPAILTNKAVALRARGVDRYNAAVQLTDDAAKTSGMEAAKKDFREAAETSTKAVQLIKAQTVPTDPAAQKNAEANKYFALAGRAEAMRLLVTKVDPSQADDGLAAFNEYIAVETKPELKLKAQVDVAQMMLDSGASDKAFAEAQKVLADNPENTDAMLIAGLALFQSGDKAKFQEAANYLQRFVDKAPETHKLRASAKDALDYLKSAENVKPQKTTTTSGGRRRG